MSYADLMQVNYLWIIIYKNISWFQVMGCVTAC